MRLDRRLTILAFHKIGEPPAGSQSRFYIPEGVFAEQLTCIVEQGWTVIDVETFLEGLESPDRLPKRGALLTFDDGYLSLLETALPVLIRFGFPAVCFVPTDFIGGWNSFDADIEPEEPICDWGDLRKLESQRVSIQSHGVSHRRFSLLDDKELAREARASKKAIEDGLEKQVRLLAFPHGDHGEDPAATARLLEQAGYRAAFLFGDGPATVGLPIRDPFLVSRLAMFRDTDLRREDESPR